MSDPGTPQQPEPPPLPATSKRDYSSPIAYGASPEPRTTRAFPVALLCIACITLGAVLAWGFKERGERARLTERNRKVEDAYTFVLAKRNDLANFLTDPATRMIRLEGRAAARGQALTIAWKDDKQTGVLIADSMPLPGDGAGYVIWVVPTAGQPLRCDSRMGAAALFSPEPGVTSFEFRALGLRAKAEGFIVTEETRKDPTSPSPRVLYASTSDKRV